MIGRGHVTRGAALIVLWAAACHGRGATTTTANGGCRAIAQTAGRYVDQAAAADREGALRFAVELIDLCQGPGIAPATRTCVTTARSPAEARTCPGLAVVPLTAAAPRREPAIPTEDGGEIYYDFDDTTITP